MQILHAALPGIQRTAMRSASEIKSKLKKFLRTISSHNRTLNTFSNENPQTQLYRPPLIPPPTPENMNHCPLFLPPFSRSPSSPPRRLPTRRGTATAGHLPGFGKYRGENRDDAKRNPPFPTRRRMLGASFLDRELDDPGEPAGGDSSSSIIIRYASRTFSSSSARVFPWLKTPGTPLSRPTNHSPSCQYSSENCTGIIFRVGKSVELSNPIRRNVNFENKKGSNRCLPTAHIPYPMVSSSNTRDARRLGRLGLPSSSQSLNVQNCYGIAKQRLGFLDHLAWSDSNAARVDRERRQQSSIVRPSRSTIAYRFTRTNLIIRFIANRHLSSVYCRPYPGVSIVRA